MASPLFELTRARVLSFVREPGSLFWVFVFPMLMAVVLGLAFRSKPPAQVSVGVVAGADQDAAAWAAGVLDRDPDIVPQTLPPEPAAEALRTGKVDLLVEVGAAPSDGQAPELTYRFDPTRPGSRGSRLAVDDALQRALGRTDPASAEEELVTEPGSRYIDFLLPGLIGLNLMGSSMWGLGFVLVMARVRKMLKRLAATPMRRSHYLLSMMLSRLVYLALEVSALLAFGFFAFGIRVRGSLLAVAVISVLGAAAFAGLALLVGARSQSIESASGLMNFVMLPMWLLSGSFFSYSQFPEAVQAVVRLLPLTALNDALRMVINDGAALLATWPQLTVLTAWGLVSFVVALKIFRWQ